MFGRFATLLRSVRRHLLWSPQVAELQGWLWKELSLIQSYIREHERLRELHYHDLMIALQRTSSLIPPSTAVLETSHPVALDTDDHKFPRGAVNDNTRCPRFVAACERHFKRPLTALDLGCSGGGLVLDFVLRGHQAFGLEGSDAPLRAQRAEWRLLGDRLFTCDITRPFRLLQGTPPEPIRFDVITAWEVLEHIAERDLPQVFASVQQHLADDGLFVGSVTTIQDDDPATGAIYHRTVEAQPWWEKEFNKLGMKRAASNPFQSADYCRGTGNGWYDPDFRKEPEHGFHFVLCKIA